MRFFDLVYDEKIVTIAKSMQHFEKNTFFRNIYLFIDQVKNFAIFKDFDMIRNNFYTYLRDITMIWYIAELFEKTKKLVKTKNNLSVWERYSIKRFRQRSTMTMIIITRERYTLDDARWCRESREYASVITRTTKSAELESNAHVIMLIYNELNAELQRNISMSELFINT